MKKEYKSTKQNRNSGITLVALIITIIILIILAAVTIKTLTHDGLLDMAIKGAQDYKVAEQKELGEMNKLSDNLNSIISGIGSEGGGKEPVVIEGVITFGELTWSNKKASVTVNKTTSDNLSIEYQVLDKDNQVTSDYQTITNGGTVSNLNLGDFVIARLTDGQNHGDTASIEVTDLGKPVVTADTGTVTTNSIQVVSVNAVDNEAGMPTTINYSYYIKTSNGSYQTVANYTGTETSYNFTGLTHKTSYDIKISATDAAGITGIKEITNITTGAVPDGSEGNIQTGVITFGSLTWSNKKASVTVNKTTSDSLSIEYQVLNKDNQEIVSYTPITNGGTVSNLNLGDFVIARLTDGQNHGNSASLEVTDGTLPTAPTFGTPSGEKKNNSGWYTGNVTVPINPGTDAESGVLKTTYSITGAGAKAETEGTSVTISSEGTSTITAYTYDNAGHKTASSTLTIKIDKTAPPAVNLTFSEKTGNTVKVTTSMTGTDAISGIAKYKMQYKKGEEKWLTATELTAISATYTYSNLEAVTSYSFRVVVVDNAGNENSEGTAVTTSTETRAPMNYKNIETTYTGKTVLYSPRAEQRYDIAANIGGTDAQTFLTSDLPDGWVIWGTDDDYIYIVSASATTKPLTLRGYNGYNNGVTLLDKICDNVYTDKLTYPGSFAQNIKGEQIHAFSSGDPYGSTTISGRVDGVLNVWNAPYVWRYLEVPDPYSTRSIAYELTDKGLGRTTGLGGVQWQRLGLCYPEYNWSSSSKSGFTVAAIKRVVLMPQGTRKYWLSSRYQGVDKEGGSFRLD